MPWILELGEKHIPRPMPAGSVNAPRAHVAQPKDDLRQFSADVGSFVPNSDIRSLLHSRESSPRAATSKLRSLRFPAELAKPNNNCAPDKLVEATSEFGRTSRVPMLWIYVENDTFFGPDLSRRMHEAFTAAGGNAEYHMLPPFGNEGHFLIGSPDSISIWSPLVTRFLDEHVSQHQTTSPSENAKAEVTPRGQRVANDITYGGWQKLCFKPGGAITMCRTTITGKFATGQIAVRVDLIEREGDDSARLQLFLPVGMYLRAGVKLSVDKGRAYQIPYTWCLTNACVAAELADPKLIEAMESGQTMEVEVVDTNILSLASATCTASPPLLLVATPAKTFEQEIDE